MAGIAGCTFIDVAGDFVMIFSQFNRIIVLMAFYATKGGEIIRSTEVAFGADSPFILVLATIDGEKIFVVVKGSRLPGVFAVAILTSRGITFGGVVRIIRAIVIRLVATYAGIRRVAVISVGMAGRTFGGNLCVCSL